MHAELVAVQGADDVSQRIEVAIGHVATGMRAFGSTGMQGAFVVDQANGFVTGFYFEEVVFGEVEFGWTGGDFVEGIFFRRGHVVRCGCDSCNCDWLTYQK